jgi:hypothetical protein
MAIDVVVMKELVYLQGIKSPQLQYSHFVSIPLALHSKLLESVVEFQKSVLESVASSSDGKVNYSLVTKDMFLFQTVNLLCNFLYNFMVQFRG